MGPASFKKLYSGCTKQKLTTMQRYGDLGEQQSEDRRPLTTEAVIASIQALRRERGSRSNSPQTLANFSSSELNFLSPTSLVRAPSSKRSRRQPCTSKTSNTSRGVSSSHIDVLDVCEEQFQADIASLASSRPSSTLSVATQRDFYLPPSNLGEEEEEPASKKAAFEDPNFLADIRSLESPAPSVSLSNRHFDEVEVVDLGVDEEDEEDEPQCKSVLNELEVFLTDIDQGVRSFFRHRRKDKPEHLNGF